MYDSSEMNNPVTMIDLIINVLIQHEKNLSEQIDRLESRLNELEEINKRLRRQKRK